MNTDINSIIDQKPHAVAKIRGSSKYPGIQGMVQFFQTRAGVLVEAQIFGLPRSSDVCHQPIFAMHIHSGTSCSGNETDPFADAKTHYNPSDCMHPYHAGDMPPLFGCNGVAVSIFLTDRFSLKDILGRTVIIHANPDDFTSQPAGNSGAKIACGVIEKI